MTHINAQALQMLCFFFHTDLIHFSKENESLPYPPVFQRKNIKEILYDFRKDDKIKNKTSPTFLRTLER